MTDTAPAAPTPQPEPDSAAPGLTLSAEQIEEATADISPDELGALNAREVLFVALLLTDPKMRGTTAAIGAGWSKKRAKQTAYEKLKDVRIQNALAAAKKARMERLGFQADEVIAEITPLIQSDVRDFELDETTGKLKLRAGADPRAWKSIASVKYKTKKNGEGKVVERECEVRFWSKTEALRLAGEHFGLYKTVVDGSINGKTGVLAVPVPVDADTWAKMAGAHQAVVTRDPGAPPPAAPPGAAS